MICERTVKKFCCEDISLIENYEKAIADTTQTWACHHRLEIQGQFTNSVELLKKCGMYYGVHASQLIFLPPSEHKSLHHTGIRHYLFGKHLSDATRQKLSEAMKGRTLSEKHRRKMSEARKGMRWWSNGRETTKAFNCPGEGWVRGRRV